MKIANIKRPIMNPIKQSSGKRIFSKSIFLQKNFDSKIVNAGKNCNPILKYYLLGLAVPLPFASTVGFIFGSLIYLKNKAKVGLKESPSS